MVVSVQLSLVYASIRLGLALIFALLIVSGYVVAPVLFAKAGSTVEAGYLAGEVFAVVNQAVPLLALAVAAFWLKHRPAKTWFWYVLLLLTLLVISNGWWVSAEIEHIKTVAGSIEQLASDNPLRKQFGMWHGVSAMIHLFASLLATILVISNSNPAVIKARQA